MSCSQTRSRVRVLFALLSTAVLVGCSAPEAPQKSGEGTTTRTNCGIDVTVDGPPERVYAAYQPAIELAHALGISDRLVGTAYLDAEVLPEYAKQQERVDYVSSLPSREALLQTDPDFVLSGFNGLFAEDSSSSVGTRASLRGLGVSSWILSPLCPSSDGRTDRAIDPGSVSVDSVYRDLRDLGALFDVSDRAKDVISDLKRRISDVEDKVADADRPSVAIVSPREDGGYGAASGIDFADRIIEHAGGTNAFGDLTDERNVEVSVEELVKRDPDVILAEACCSADLTRADAADEVHSVTTDAALDGVTAVRDDHVYPFLFANRSAGVRAAHSIELVASLIHPELVERDG